MKQVELLTRLRMEIRSVQSSWASQVTQLAPIAPPSTYVGTFPCAKPVFHVPVEAPDPQTVRALISE